MAAPLGTVQQQPKPEHLSEGMVCVYTCVCVFGRVARDDGVCLAGWLSNNQVKCPIMSILYFLDPRSCLSSHRHHYTAGQHG